MNTIKIRQFFIRCFVIGVIGSKMTFSSAQMATTVAAAEVRVSVNGNDVPECVTNSSHPCRSIYYAMTNIKTNKNVRIILESGKHFLNSTIKIKHADMFELTGDAKAADKPIIYCAEKQSAIYFSQSHRLYFQWFRLEECGGIFESSSIVNNTHINVTTALHLNECKDVTVKHIDINNSSGVGALFYDVSGQVNFHNVTFSNNKEMTKHRNGSASGGGVYIEFRPHESGRETVFNSDASYVFKNCKFLDNEAEHVHGVISDSFGDKFVSFGRGGGISFITRGKSNNNSLVVDSCSFQRNKALWGSGIFAEFNDESEGHVINITATSFRSNIATMAGGGVRIGTNLNEIRDTVRVNLADTNFTQNSAKIGGGFSQYRLSTDNREENGVTMRKCHFVNNTAYVATAIHIQYINLLLSDCSILNDSTIVLKNDASQRQGALYSYKSNITMYGSNTISGNHYTAFILDASLLFLFGSSWFTHNIGDNGGAMALYSHSTIRMTNGSRLYFHYNSAKKRGGAMYVETPVQSQSSFFSTELKIYKCFLMFGEVYGDAFNTDQFDAKLYFKGNSAPERYLGTTIWTTTLRWCREKNEPVYNNTVLNSWKTVDFSGDDPLTSVASSPTYIEIKYTDWDAYPGLDFQPRITLKDENWNTIFGMIKITLVPVIKDSVTIPYTHTVLSSNTSFRMYGDLNAEFSLILETTERYSASKVISGRRLKPNCPPGFNYDNDQKSCVCLGVKDGVSKCDTKTRQVSILPGRWGNPKGGTNFARHSCPPHYCRKCDWPNNGCIYDRPNQCAAGRKHDSVLCGQCEDGLSVVVGAEECTKCDERAKGLFVILFVLLFVILVLAIMFINLDAYSSYLNAFLYSYQIVPLITQDIMFDPVCSFLIAVTNLSGFGQLKHGMCIGLHLNNMQKIALNYLVPTFIILCIVIIGAMSYCFKRLPFNKKTCFRAFVFISVIAYCDYTKITFELLKPVSIGGTWYVYYAAYMPYFGKEHAGYAVLAIFVSLIVLGFPLALIMSHKITSNAKLIKLKAIIDTFQDPFRDDANMKKFPAFYFLTRLVLLLIDSTVEQRGLHRALMGIACVAIACIFTVLKPYKSQIMNYHDSLLLLNIAIIAVFNVALGEAYVTKERTGIEVTVRVLVYIPFLCISIRALWWLGTTIKRCRAGKGARNTSGRSHSVLIASRLYDDVNDHPYDRYEDHN
eukprot:gene6807-7576_t